MIRRILPKAYAALLLYLGFSPLVLLPAAVLLPEKIWLAMLLPVPALMLTGWAGLRPPNRRTAALAVSILAMAAGYAVLFLTVRPLAMLLFLPCLFFMLLFMPAMARPAHLEWSVSYLGFGAALHIVAQFLKGVKVFTPAAAPLTWIFTVYLIACLFAFNRSVLTDANPAASKPLLLANRKLIVIVCLISLLLSNLKAVGVAVRAAIAWIIIAVAQVILWIASLFSSEGKTAATQQGRNPFESLAEASEPSLFSKIAEIALIVIALLIAAVALYFALKHLIRLLQKLYRIILERLKLYHQRISADYDDQSESLLDWGEIQKTAKKRIEHWKKRFLPTPWEKLSPAQRVRRVYAILLRKPEAPDPALTAREMLLSGALKLKNADAAHAAAIYDQARYSDHPVAVQQADELRKRTGV
jgi:hypothetical protein